MKCPFCGRANVIEVMTRFERGPGNATVQAVRYCDNCGTVFGEEKRHIDAILAERDGYRAVAEQRAAEVERLRGAMEEHETTIRALSRSDVERFKENNALNAKLGRLRGALDCANEWNSIWRVMNAYASGEIMTELSGGCDPHSVLGHVYQGMAIIYQRRNVALAPHEVEE